MAFGRWNAGVFWLDSQHYRELTDYKSVLQTLRVFVVNLQLSPRQRSNFEGFDLEGDCAFGNLEW